MIGRFEAVRAHHHLADTRLGKKPPLTHTPHTLAPPRGSPLSQRVTWRQLQRGAALGSLAECLAMEAGIAYHMLALPSDFCEGVRAALLDKDGRPRWRCVLLFSDWWLYGLVGG